MIVLFVYFCLTEYTNILLYNLFCNSIAILSKVSYNMVKDF